MGMVHQGVWGGLALRARSLVLAMGLSLGGCSVVGAAPLPAAWPRARLGGTVHGDGHRGMLQKVQGEQEKQGKPSCREITATSKGNEMVGQQPPCLAQCLSLPSCRNGVAQSCSFLELWLLRDVSHCQHGVEFNAYLYFYGVAVAQQPVQILWLKCACSEEPAACTVRGSMCPTGFRCRSMVRSSVLGAPLLLFIYQARTREEWRREMLFSPKK